MGERAISRSGLGFWLIISAPVIAYFGTVAGVEMGTFLFPGNPYAPGVGGAVGFGVSLAALD